MTDFKYDLQEDSVSYYLIFKLRAMSFIFKLLWFLCAFLLILIVSYSFIQFVLNYCEIDTELLPVCISLMVAAMTFYNGFNKHKV